MWLLVIGLACDVSRCCPGHLPGHAATCYLGKGVTREANVCVGVADVVRVDVPEVSYLLFDFYRV